MRRVIWPRPLTKRPTTAGKRPKPLSYKRQCHSVLIDQLPDPFEDLGFADGEVEEMLRQLKEADQIDKIYLDRESDGCLQAYGRGERYVGFNLNEERRRLLEQAVTRAERDNQDPYNPRAGCLEVILKTYLHRPNTMESHAKLP